MTDMNVMDLMTSIEKDRYIAFCEKHKDCEFNSTIGGKISVHFTPTGLGHIIECMCNACGETEDITNTDNW